MSEEDPRPKELRVTVNAEPMEKLIRVNDQLAKEKEELQSQVESAQESQELMDSLKEKASTELTALGIETNPEDIKSKADLDRAVETIQKLRAKTHTGNEGGSAPLNQAQISGISQKEGYGTHEEMIRDLRERNARGDPTAKEALRQLTFKALKGMRETHVEPYKEPQKEMTTSDLSPDLRLVVKPDPLGIEHAYRKKKLMERAEKGDSQALEILNSGNY